LPPPINKNNFRKDFCEGEDASPTPRKGINASPTPRKGIKKTCFHIDLEWCGAKPNLRGKSYIVKPI
jgi:hypothetical protein